MSNASGEMCPAYEEDAQPEMVFPTVEPEAVGMGRVQTGDHTGRRVVAVSGPGHKYIHPGSVHTHTHVPPPGQGAPHTHIHSVSGPGPSPGRGGSDYSKVVYLDGHTFAGAHANPHINHYVQKFGSAHAIAAGALGNTPVLERVTYKVRFAPGESVVSVPMFSSQTPYSLSNFVAKTVLPPSASKESSSGAAPLSMDDPLTMTSAHRRKVCSARVVGLYTSADGMGLGIRSSTFSPVHSFVSTESSHSAKPSIARYAYYNASGMVEPSSSISCPSDKHNDIKSLYMGAIDTDTFIRSCYYPGHGDFVVIPKSVVAFLKAGGILDERKCCAFNGHPNHLLLNRKEFMKIKRDIDFFHAANYPVSDETTIEFCLDRGDVQSRAVTAIVTLEYSIVHANVEFPVNAMIYKFREKMSQDAEKVRKEREEREKAMKDTTKDIVYMQLTRDMLNSDEFATVLC